MENIRLDYMFPEEGPTCLGVGIPQPVEHSESEVHCQNDDHEL